MSHVTLPRFDLHQFMQSWGRALHEPAFCNLSPNASECDYRSLRSSRRYPASLVQSFKTLKVERIGPSWSSLYGGTKQRPVKTGLQAIKVSDTEKCKDCGASLMSEQRVPNAKKNILLKFQ